MENLKDLWTTRHGNTKLPKPCKNSPNWAMDEQKKLFRVKYLSVPKLYFYHASSTKMETTGT